MTTQPYSSLHPCPFRLVTFSFGCSGDHFLFRPTSTHNIIEYTKEICYSSQPRAQMFIERSFSSNPLCRNTFTLVRWPIFSAIQTGRIAVISIQCAIHNARIMYSKRPRASLLPLYRVMWRMAAFTQ